MHIYFSGIGGSGMAALALVAKQAGYQVSGSDARPSQYLEYLHSKGIDKTHIGVDRQFISTMHKQLPIDWFVYGSAQPRDFPNHPEFVFCEEKNIRISKRDDLLNEIMSQKELKLIAVAGTHGKSTTTAMAIWLLQQYDIPVSYSVGAKIGFGDIGHYEHDSKYFVYEADEFDRNFLAFHPYMNLITGIDWDHPDIYPTRENYYQAFKQFLSQSQHATLWQEDIDRLQLEPTSHHIVLSENESRIDQSLKLLGQVNRRNAWQVANGLQTILNKPLEELIKKMNEFPGLSRRFEEIAPYLYSDYAHTPGKIRGALQLAHEVAGDKVVVVYEGLHNLRQHFIKDEFRTIFDNVKHLYIVPSFLGREDPSLALLKPKDQYEMLSEKSKTHAEPAHLNGQLKAKIEGHLANKETVICFTAGSGDSLDDWLRKEFAR